MTGSRSVNGRSALVKNEWRKKEEKVAGRDVVDLVEKLKSLCYGDSVQSRLNVALARGDWHSDVKGSRTRPYSTFPFFVLRTCVP